MTFRAAIFDMDGVVVDTVPIHFSAWKRMFNEYGHEFSFEDYKEKVDGIPRIDGASNILTELSKDKIIEAASKKQGYFVDELSKTEILQYDSTVALIDELQKNDIKVAVISSSKNAKHILTKIGVIDRLDGLITGNDISKGKPDPQTFLLAADQVQAEPTECVVIEDAVLGIEGAINGHMKCIGVDRYNKPERLAKADLVVSDLSEVNFEKMKALFD